MYIHHLNHAKDKLFNGFKHYLNEFLILFLAITASFFVENYRERYIERHREMQFIESLIRDVQSDTVDIQNIKTSIEKQVKGIDSLLVVLENPKTDSTIRMLYLYSFNYLGSVALFTPSDRTIVQLKNAGGLRLIQKKGASDSIIVYYNLMDNVEYNTDFNLRLYDRVLSMMKEIFEFKTVRNPSNLAASNEKNLKLHLQSLDQLNTYYNEVLIYESSLQAYTNLLTIQHEEAIALLNFLKKSYRLK